MWGWRWRCVFCWWAAFACQPGAEVAPLPLAATLPPGVAARVGTDDVPVALIESMVSRQGITPVSARDRAIDDALFAAEARAGLGDDPWVRRAEDAVLAAALVTELAEQSRDAGPITDPEIAWATERRWREFDRPAAARTVHAVVLLKDPSQEEAGRVLAERIAVSVRGVSVPEAFLQKARDVPAGALEVRAEALPAIAADGREVDPSAPPEQEPGHFDLAFAKAANALTHVGDQSPVVRTSFGLHVILLTERLAEHRPSLAERRQLLAADVLSERARRLFDDTLVRLRAREPVEVLPTAPELTAAVKPRP
jgi:hypothetical protein